MHLRHLSADSANQHSIHHAMKSFIFKDEIIKRLASLVVPV